MNEIRIKKLLDSLTIEQTDQLMDNITLDADRFTKKRVLKQLKEKAHGAPKLKLRFLIPIAACACTVVLIFTAVPGVAIAIQEFFNKTFSASSYMSTPEAEREAIADVDEIIQHPVQTPGFEVLLGTETAHWDNISATRQELGFPDFVEEDFAWIREIQPEVKEILYDGDNIIVTGFMTTKNALSFYPSYMSVPDAEQHVTLSGASLDYGSGNSLGGGADVQLDPKAYTGGAGKCVANMEYIQAQGGFPFKAYFILSDNGVDPLPDGTINATLTLDINDGSVDDMGGVGTIAQIRLPLSFDATQGNATKETIEPGQIQAVSGNAIITVHYDPENGHTYGNINAPLDGMELSVDRIEKSQTGLSVYITEKLPVQWSEEVQAGYKDGYSAKFGGLKFVLMIDGQDQGIVRPSGGTDYGWQVDIPILPSELETISSLELIPIIEYMAAFNGEAVPLDDKKTFDLAEAEGWEDTTEHTQLDDFSLNIIPG